MLGVERGPSYPPDHNNLSVLMLSYLPSSHCWATCILLIVELPAFFSLLSYLPSFHCWATCLLPIAELPAFFSLLSYLPSSHCWATCPLCIAELPDFFSYSEKKLFSFSSKMEHCLYSTSESVSDAKILAYQVFFIIIKNKCSIVKIMDLCIVPSVLSRKGYF